MLVATLGEVLILAWFFLTGSVLGSFLNVVIYRVPRGLSLVHPPSRCPVCLHPIRWHDNIPIFGWFLLRGRCRDCGARIAKRYPVVEALAGLEVLLIALRNGNWRWVPALDSLLQEGVIQPGLIETAVSVGVSLSLLAAAIILYDGARVPLSFWTVAIVLVLIGHMAVTRTINHGENPPYGPPLGRTTPAPPQLRPESRAEAPFQSTFGKTKDRLIPLLLDLAGGVLLDLWLGQKAGAGRVSGTHTLKGAGIAGSTREGRSHKKSPDSGKPEPIEHPRKSPRSGWEYSFACATCGWTFGRPTEAGIAIGFLAALATIAFCVRKRRCDSAQVFRQRSRAGEIEPASTPAGDPGRIRSVPMFGLWLLFLCWVVVR